MSDAGSVTAEAASPGIAKATWAASGGLASPQNVGRGEVVGGSAAYPNLGGSVSVKPNAVAAAGYVTAPPNHGAYFGAKPTTHPGIAHQHSSAAPEARAAAKAKVMHMALSPTRQSYRQGSSIGAASHASRVAQWRSASPPPFMHPGLATGISQSQEPGRTEVSVASSAVGPVDGQTASPTGSVGTPQHQINAASLLALGASLLHPNKQDINSTIASNLSDTASSKHLEPEGFSSAAEALERRLEVIVEKHFEKLVVAMDKVIEHRLANITTRLGRVEEDQMALEKKTQSDLEQDRSSMASLWKDLTTKITAEIDNKLDSLHSMLEPTVMRSLSATLDHHAEDARNRVRDAEDRLWPALERERREREEQVQRLTSALAEIQAGGQPQAGSIQADEMAGRLQMRVDESTVAAERKQIEEMIASVTGTLRSARSGTQGGMYGLKQTKDPAAPAQTAALTVPQVLRDQGSAI